MTLNIRVSLVIIVLLIPAGMLSAQQSGTATSSQPTAQTNPASIGQSLLSEATAADPFVQQQALTQIEGFLNTKTGSTGSTSGSSSGTGVDNAVLVSALDRLALSGVSYVAQSATTVLNDFPWIRLKACTLLGEIGGANAEKTLLRVVMQDSEPMVLSEAVFQLGRIGQDPNGQVSLGIAWRLQQTTSAHPDDNLAFACLVALEKLAKAQNGLREPGVYNAIAGVASGDYIQVVKDKAAQVLAELAKY